MLVIGSESALQVQQNSGSRQLQQTQQLNGSNRATSKHVPVCIGLVIPFIIFALSILSPLVVTQIRGHTAGSSPPLPTTVRFVLCTFIARRLHSALSSLVDSRRTAPTHDWRSQQLVLSNFAKKSKSDHGGIRTPGPTLAAFERSLHLLSSDNFPRPEWGETEDYQ